ALRRRIAHLQFADIVANQAVGFGGAIYLELSGTPQGNRQVQDFVADVPINIDRCRHRRIVGHLKGRAVGKDSGETRQSKLADSQKIPLDLDLGEAPGVSSECLATSLDVALEVAILLLKVLRLKEESLGPDDFVGNRHSRQLWRPKAVCAFRSRSVRVT